jgi:uncharacterized OB-fold protein
MEVTKQMVEKTVTALKREDVLGGKVITTSWDPKLEYAWDDGVAIGRYLAELKNGRIIGKHCRKCDRVMLPPRLFCELCWRPTFCVSHVNWKAGRLDIEGGERPYTPAVIEIDGAAPGMGILHHINEVDPWQIEIGMKVRAVWKPAEERQGAITDIRYFVPVQPPRKSGKAATKADPKKKAKRTRK